MLKLGRSCFPAILPPISTLYVHVKYGSNLIRTYTTHNKLRILGLIFVQFIYLIFLVTEICMTAKMSDYDQNKTLDMKILNIYWMSEITQEVGHPQIEKL